jgi:hypothetical protein
MATRKEQDTRVLARLVTPFFIPRPPNYIRGDYGVVYDVADLDDKTLCAVAREWKNALLVNAARRRAAWETSATRRTACRGSKSN